VSARRPTPRDPVTVEIGGERHVLRSDVSPEYTRAVAEHLDAAVRALPSFATLEPYRAAILAALSITDDLFRARAEVERLREEIRLQTSRAVDLLADGADAADDEPAR
jgi:cell division protein ZapA